MAASLPDRVLVRVEAVVWRCEGGGEEEGEGREQRRSLHVQSHSEWAPANIGPYSQAYTVRSMCVCVCVEREGGRGRERERERERERDKPTKLKLERGILCSYLPSVWMLSMTEFSMDTKIPHIPEINFLWILGLP